MSVESEKLAREWLKKAHGDLIVACLLIENQQIQLDAGVYHSQQAAEKALKAALTWRELVFPKTHDLKILLRLLLPVEPSLGTHESGCEKLTPYAIQFRYPGDLEHPPEAEAKEALAYASRIVEKVDRILQTEENIQG